jgi:hypothetical protein
MHHPSYLNRKHQIAQIMYRLGASGFTMIEVLISMETMGIDERYIYQCKCEFLKRGVLISRGVRVSTGKGGRKVTGEVYFAKNIPFEKFYRPSAKGPVDLKHDTTISVTETRIATSNSLSVQRQTSSGEARPPLALRFASSEDLRAHIKEASNLLRQFEAYEGRVGGAWEFQKGNARSYSHIPGDGRPALHAV